MANYWGCVNWKEAKAALARQAPVRGQKNAATGRPAAPNAGWARSLCWAEEPEHGEESRCL